MFRLAQSCMPALEIQGVKSPQDPSLSPWFKLDDGDELVSPVRTFRGDQRKRWPQGCTRILVHRALHEKAAHMRYLLAGTVLACAVVEGDAATTTPLIELLE
ncbi:MAG: DUF4846 domain-containing protein [Flavobacteriales bacterium]|nr:DUF4846 domain-containing protein [Flavobacteriales bacterium]